MCLLSSSFCFLSVMFIERALPLKPPNGIRHRLKIYDFIPLGRHLLFLPWRKKVSKKGQDYTRFTRKTSVIKAEIVETSSLTARLITSALNGFLSLVSGSLSLVNRFHPCFSAHRSRSVLPILCLLQTGKAWGVRGEMCLSARWRGGVCNTPVQLLPTTAEYSHTVID